MRARRSLASGLAALVGVLACGVLLVAWLAPDNVMALWRLAAFCG
jgi:hypothetical protein